MQYEESKGSGDHDSTAPVEGSSWTSNEHYGLPVVLTVAEAAEFLRLNTKTLYAAIGAGEVPGRRVGGRLVVFRDALLDWLKSSGSVLPSRRGATR